MLSQLYDSYRRDDDDSGCDETPAQDGPSQPCATPWADGGFEHLGWRQGERDYDTTIAAASKVIEYDSTFGHG